MHKTAQIRSRRFQYKMDMVVHQAEQIEADIKLPHTIGQLLKKPLPIKIVLEDNAAVVTPQGYMVNRTFVFYT
jgi:hypothetical protein